ncbi:MAG: hypothetical protein ABIO71_09895 [Caldimonas sp.]
MKTLSIALVVLLGGCAVSQGVVPMADGTYRVTAEANFGPNKAIEARKLALDEATRTCAAQGREVAVTRIDNSGDIGRAAGPLALRGETTLVFRCADRRL